MRLCCCASHLLPLPLTARLLCTRAAGSAHVQSLVVVPLPSAYRIELTLNDCRAWLCALQIEPRPAMSLLSTADVVLQLMLQHLPPRDIIAFARCNRTTMRIAAAPVVWQNVTFRLNLTAEENSRIPALPLLRHV